MIVYLDENLSEFVAEALNSLNRGYFPNIEVQSTINAFGRGVPDETIIPEVGGRNAILITRDINIQRTKLQYNLCKEHNLGVFFLNLPKGQNNHWMLVKTLIKEGEEILQIAQRKRKPFFYRIGVKSVTEM